MKKNEQKLQKYRGGKHLNRDKPDVILKNRRGKMVPRKIRDEKVMPKFAGYFDEHNPSGEGIPLGDEVEHTEVPA